MAGEQRNSTALDLRELLQQADRAMCAELTSKVHIVMSLTKLFNSQCRRNFYKLKQAGFLCCFSPFTLTVRASSLNPGSCTLNGLPTSSVTAGTLVNCAVICIFKVIIIS